MEDEKEVCCAVADGAFEGVVCEDWDDFLPVRVSQIDDILSDVLASSSKKRKREMSQ